ncbi:MAG: response regulator [Candidatus Zambryskibacteria bacterium]|nr:response regulator [Candidatus Zambryskibacteria bacterium]
MENTQLKILLVDDDRFLLDMYSLKFKKFGIEIDTVATSLMALEKLKTGTSYDILILDIIMPSMDGLELLKKIREEKLVPNAAVIMLTNQADDLDKAKALGVDDYIIKATTIPSEVVERVVTVYKNKQAKIS